MRLLNDPSELLGGALLVTFVLFLVYLMYRRLLVMLGKEEADVRFTHFSGEEVLLSENSVSVALDVPQEMHVLLELLDQEGKTVHVWHNGTLQAGSHRFSRERNGLAPGKYICRFSTAHQRAERYFKQ